MMSTHAWQRLAELLAQRRAELRTEWRNRSVFARDTGVGYRSVSDMETARRTSYSPALLAQVERAYEWAPGSIRKILEGGDPTPLHEAGAGDDPEWEGSLQGPSGPLGENEVLRWRLRGDGRIQYEILDTQEQISTGTLISADLPLYTAAREMRDQLEAHRLQVAMMERRHGQE